MAYIISFMGVCLVALVHLGVHRLRFMSDTAFPWIAASAGVAVSYVFINLLPKLAAGHSVLAASQSSSWLRYIVGTPTCWPSSGLPLFTPRTLHVSA